MVVPLISLFWSFEKFHRRYTLNVWQYPLPACLLCYILISSGTVLSQDVPDLRELFSPIFPGWLGLILEIYALWLGRLLWCFPVLHCCCLCLRPSFPLPRSREQSWSHSTLSVGCQSTAHRFADLPSRFLLRWSSGCREPFVHKSFHRSAIRHQQVWAGRPEIVMNGGPCCQSQLYAHVDDRLYITDIRFCQR